MIEFCNVSVRYPDADRRALDDVSFIVPMGKVTAVAGPNGSGKSTLVRAILGRVKLDRGSIAVNGDQLSSIDARELALRVAVAPQREELAFAMSVDEYVGLGRYPSLGLWQSPGRRDKEAARSSFGADECAHLSTSPSPSGHCSKCARREKQELSSTL